MGDLIMENNNVQSIIIGCIIVVVVMVLLYVIISLIADHIEETKKAKQLMNNLEPARLGPNDAVKEQGEMSNNSNVNGQFYSSVAHFTDTGKSMTQSQYNGMNTTFYDDVQFVIVKSLIYTETREEID